MCRRAGGAWAAPGARHRAGPSGIGRDRAEPPPHCPPGGPGLRLPAPSSARRRREQRGERRAAQARENKMKELMSNSTTNISQARKAVEQLKMEAYMDRMKVSKAAADLLAYCDAHIGEDPLIIPVPASENPFREKKLFCTIL
uniref:Guanine nucleotide-binding protein subunit gamma n=1 Tax=Anas zonorhyncha TaxID=75864 RepID=A0A8B9VRW8_9AVES